MSLKNRYILKELFKYFLIFTVSLAFFLFIMEIFDGIIAYFRDQSPFLWGSYLNNLPPMLYMVSPLITLLSILFVFSEIAKFREIEIFEITGRKPFHILVLFFYFGIFTSVIFFLMINLCQRKNYYPESEKHIHLASQDFVFWAEKYNPADLFVFADVVIITYEKNRFLFYQAQYASPKESAFLLEKGSVRDLINPLVPGENFNFYNLEVPFNTKNFMDFILLDVDNSSFFTVLPVLKSMEKIGFFQKDTWITLYDKIAYPLLNFFFVFIILPFFYNRNVFSRFKIFLLAIIISIVSYSIYSIGLSLGENNTINWWISPWIFHIIIFFAGILYLIKKEKLSIINQEINHKNHINEHKKPAC